MVIPRENSLVRFYVQINEVKPDQESGRADRSQITPELILKAAQRTLAPYKLEYEHIHWWTGKTYPPSALRTQYLFCLVE